MAVMRHVALSGQQAYISSFSKIHNRNGMRLRPTVIDHMLDPFTITGVFEPEDAVAVRHRGDNVWTTIPVNVAYVHEAEGVVEIPIRMELPVLLPRIGGSFQPALRGKDIVAAVAVYIAPANPMTVAVVADDALHHSAVLIPLVPGKRTIVSELRQNLIGFTIVIKINQKRKLDGGSGGDGMLFPHAAGGSRIAPPRQLLAKPS